METVIACLKIIWTCRAAGPLKWWALENPRGFLRQFLGKPALSFKPCDYGDPHTKATDLWGYFSDLKQNPVKVDKPKGRMAGGTRDWSFAKRKVDGLTRKELRSITPPKFAKAFFKANP